MPTSPLRQQVGFFGGFGENAVCVKKADVGIGPYGEAVC